MISLQGSRFTVHGSPVCSKVGIIESSVFEKKQDFVIEEGEKCL